MNLLFRTQIPQLFTLSMVSYDMFGHGFFRLGRMVNGVPPLTKDYERLSNLGYPIGH